MKSSQSNSSPKQTDLLSAIMDSAVDSIIVIDRGGIIQSVNPATMRVFGFSPDEILGRNVKVLMPPPFREEHDGYLERYHRTGERRIIGIGREVVGRRKDGSEFPMHLAVSEFVLGGETHYAGIVRDISDLKNTQNELRELNEALETRVRERTEELRKTQAKLVAKEKLATMGQVSAGIAHEIRNPLNAVRMSAYFLMNAQSISPGKLREHLERIDRQVGVIDNVVTALSDVARLPEPNLICCSLQSIIADALSSVSGLEDIKIDNALVHQDAKVLGDQNQLLIVFRNLIRNARDAMSDEIRSTQPAESTKQKRLILTVNSSEGRTSLSVGDTGVGISPENLGNILDPFFSTKARGMGLGLAITRAILERNGATLRVESELGEGATFTVELKSGDANNTQCNPGDPDSSEQEPRS